MHWEIPAALLEIEAKDAEGRLIARGLSPPTPCARKPPRRPRNERLPTGHRARTTQGRSIHVPLSLGGGARGEGTNARTSTSPLVLSLSKDERSPHEAHDPSIPSPPAGEVRVRGRTPA